MRIIGKSHLDEFVKAHPEVKPQIETWLTVVGEATWRDPMDVKATYGSASILKRGGVVFNIKGNRFRLHVKISYMNQIASIKNIGTHNEYLTWNLDDD